MYAAFNMISAIALDLGSTSIKAGLLHQDGTLGGIVAMPAPAIQATHGRYESDALAYARLADQVLDNCLAQLTSPRVGELPPMGLCSQRSSFLIWDKASGKPITPLISWQDNRGLESCTALKSQESLIAELSGLRLTPYFFAAKLRVVLLENPQWRQPLVRGEWLLGTLDTYLLWRWSDGKQHVSDVSMAARTLLMDVRQQQWSPVLCELFGIPLSILPNIQASTGFNLRLKNGLTLRASLADQSAALLASVGEDREVALVNLGTGGFVIRYLPDNQAGIDRYLHTLVFKENTGRTHIALEGTLNSIASALASYPVAACRLEELGLEKDIFCIAEPSGLGAPYFRPDLGLQFSRSVDQLTQNQIAVLVLEAIIFRVVRILEDFQRCAAIKRVYLSGGLSELTILQQGIAQCLHCEVFRLQQREASLQGAAMLAAGRLHVSDKENNRILLTHPSSALVEKYQHWKVWLDTLLIA